MCKINFSPFFCGSSLFLPQKFSQLIFLVTIFGLIQTLAISIDFHHLSDEEHASHQNLVSFDRKKLQSKIFDGALSTTSYGFMVAIIQGNSSDILCGASLIDESHILTAGHCAEGILDSLENNEKIEAWIAPNQLSHFHGQKIPIKNVTRHEGFEPRPSLHNDISVATLEFPVDFDISSDNEISSVKPKSICVGEGNYHDSNVILIGFGNYDCFSSSDQLRSAAGSALNKTACQLEGHKKKNLLDSQICAKLFNGNHEKADQAPGDSGGPLFFQNEHGNFVQVGLVSYNYIKDGRKDSEGNAKDPCPNLEIPGTYTIVGAFRNFIQQIAPNSRFCL